MDEERGRRNEGCVERLKYSSAVKRVYAIIMAVRQLAMGLPDSGNGTAGQLSNRMDACTMKSAMIDGADA